MTHDETRIAATFDEHLRVLQKATWFVGLSCGVLALVITAALIPVPLNPWVFVGIQLLRDLIMLSATVAGAIVGFMTWPQTRQIEK